MNGPAHRRLFTAVRLLAVLVLLLALVGQPGLHVRAQPTAQDGPPAQGLAAGLSFSSAPTVGTPAELVLEVSAAQAVNFQAQIDLPVGLEIITGSLAGQGSAGPEGGWKTAVLLRAAAPGEYAITARVEGTTAAGQPVSAETVLYLATSESMASAGELPVRLPAAPPAAAPALEGEPPAAEGDTDTIQPDHGLRAALDPALVDESQPPSSVVSTESAPLALVERAERDLLTTPGMGLASDLAPFSFTVQEPAPAEGLPLVGAPEQALLTGVSAFSDPPVLVDRASLDQRAFIPQVSQGGTGSRAASEGESLLASPDLLVDDIWTTTNPLIMNEWDTIVFQLRNAGGSTSATFHTRMWLAGYHINYWYTNGLPGGYITTGSISVRIAPAGYWSVMVATDINNVVAETSESNNSRTEYWLWKSYGRDIIVEDIYTSTLPLIAQDWENVTFVLRNVGTVDVPNTFYSRLLFDGSVIGYWYTTGLRSGYSSVGTLNVRTPPGNHTLRLDTDIYNVVAETNEGNSRAETWRWSYTGNTDLITYDIYSTTNPLVGGTAENITFEIRSVGSTPAYIQGETVTRLTALNVADGGEAEVYWNRDLGTPSLVAGDLAVQGATPAEAAARFFTAFAPLYGLTDAGAELVLAEESPDDLGMTHLHYRQVYAGLPVYNGELVAHIAADGQVTSVNGSFVPNLSLSPQPEIAAAGAVEAARQAAGAAGALTIEAPELLVYTQGPNRHLAWSVRLDIDGYVTRIFVDAHTGQSLGGYEETVHARNRLTYSAGNTETFRRTLMLTESSTTYTDGVAWSAHVFMGYAYDYFRNNFGRDSFDNAGAAIISNVHFGAPGSSAAINAFWDPRIEQFAFGDGDGRLFIPLARAMDVVVHEFTHAVISHEANLTYTRQSGALNESYADVFAVMVDRGDWLIGEDVTTPGTAGDALRDMANPRLGVSRQVEHMSQFIDYPWYTICNNSNDNCGVHTNSGIPNKAAYLISDGGVFGGVRVFGIGKAKLERIYYRALADYLTAGSNFMDTRNLTLRACYDLYGAGGQECRAVQDGFAAVGVGAQSGFYTRMYIDSALVNTWFTPDLRVGYVAIGALTRTLPSGQHTIRVDADYDNRIIELNNTNNIRIETWTWQ